MKTILSFVISASMLLAGCGSHEKAPAAMSRVPPKEILQDQALEGAYRFVSEDTFLEKPERPTRRISSAWEGLWIFHDRHYSRTLMKKERDFSTLSPDSVGYESDAGNYKIEGRTIVLLPELTLYPLARYYQSLEFDFRLEGNKLVLTRTIRPRMEDLSAGRQTIVLERAR